MSISLETLLKKALQEEPLSREEVLCLLNLKEEDEKGKLFETARMLRRRYFEESIFLYGFIYFSTWCRNDCTFCYYRSSNELPLRYRKPQEQVLEVSATLANSGVHLLDLTMGEDPNYFHKKKGVHILLSMIQEVKKKTGLPIMISCGVWSDEVLDDLAEYGADWFACYQETHNPTLFQALRPLQDYNRRLLAKRSAVQAGMLIEEGILSGVGESLEDVADSIHAMKQMNPHQARVMNFVPQRGTPMANYPFPPPDREQVILAVLRLTLPRRLIPASLDVNGIQGLKGKLKAGANVVTSLIPASSGMKGVAQSELGIFEGQRTVGAILPILEELELKKASLQAYLNWVGKQKQGLFH
jgi:methylornithine synthase